MAAMQGSSGLLKGLTYVAYSVAKELKTRPHVVLGQSVYEGSLSPKE